MIIRQLQQSDKKRWISFFRGLSKETIENRYYHSVKNIDPDVIKFYWEDTLKNSISLIAEVDDEIVGIIGLYVNKPANHGEIAITIADKYQNNGIGSQLMIEIETVAKNMKLKMIWFITQNIQMKKIAEKYNYIRNKYGWEKEI